MKDSFSSGNLAELEASIKHATGGEILCNCMDLLGIDNASVRTDATDLLKHTLDRLISDFGILLVSMKAIADSCLTNNYFLEDSRLNDYLTVCALALGSRRGDNYAMDAMFYIYKDILQNYNNSDEHTKVKYPMIIADVICILNKGVNFLGDKVPRYDMPRYYEDTKLRKGHPESFRSELTLRNKLEIGEILKEGIRSERIKTELSPGLLKTLSRITSRNEDSLMRSISGIDTRDLDKLIEICNNYEIIVKFSSISESKQMRKDLERHTRRRLSDNQICHAKASLRRLREYVESTLDEKFVVDDYHHICHVKHNYEYGLQILGILKPVRSRKT